MSSVQKPIFVSITNGKDKYPDRGPEIHKAWFEAIVGVCQTVKIDADKIFRENWYKSFECLNGSNIYSYIYIYIGVHGIIKNGVQFIKFNESFFMSENEFMGMLSRSLSSNIYVFFEICHASHFTLVNMEDCRISKNITLFSTCVENEKATVIENHTLLGNYSIGVCTNWLYQNRMNPFKDPDNCYIALNKYLDKIRCKDINQHVTVIKYQSLN